jgi:Rieske Fe-S protein
MIRTAALVPLAAKVGCARRIDLDRQVAVPDPVDGELKISLALAPELGTAGGAIVATSLGPTGPVLVANTGTGYLAVGGICPHNGCNLAWVQEDRQVECPCHGSRFAGDGTVLHPPANVDIESFPVEADAQGNVIVHLFAGEGVLKNLQLTGGQVSFAIADFPALQSVGGVVGGRPNGFPTPLLITRLATGNGPDAVGAINAICTHLGCTVLPGAGTLQCPCHGSVFDLAGGFVQGPAGTGLLRYVAGFDGTTVTISTAFRS